MKSVAAVTMVRDDVFFLNAWLRHYGTALGRENCTIINHGYGAAVTQMAAGCNVIGIPGDPHPNFDMKRWRLLNNIVQGLRSYYDHVIVGDVDELVVVDPATGLDLAGFLAKAKGRRVLTPVGLEVLHHVKDEPEAITDQILGPRRFVRPAPHYSKPCILSTGAKIARGGHFTQYDQLHAPDGLYLMHLKFCDFGEYVRAMDRRNAVSASVGVGPRDAAIGRHWFSEARGDDKAVFDAFTDMPLQPGFDLSGLRKQMAQTWAPRGDTGFWEFARPDFKVRFALPDRFYGLI